MSLTNEDKDWINAQLERVETSLLTGFHKSALDVELEAVSERVTRLEPPLH